MVLSIATTGPKQKVVLIIDVSRAYMYARIPEGDYIYVALPEEAIEHEADRQKCWRLKGAMYGTRKAAQYWQSDASGTLQQCGFRMGKASPCAYVHSERDISGIVHGDDFVVACERKDADWLLKKMGAKYAIKSTMIGEDKDLPKEARILNRLLTWHPGVGLAYEADPRHVEAIIKDTGADKLTTLTSPAVKEEINETIADKENDIEGRRKSGKLGGKYSKKKKEEIETTAQGYVYYDKDDGKLNEYDEAPWDIEAGDTTTTGAGDDDQLVGAEATQFRAISARGNFLAPDRPDIMFAVKECSRRMSAPTKRDFGKLVRLGQYLKRRPRAILWFEYQDAPETMLTMSDTDWAGCKTTRRSTSGGVCVHGSHMIKCWCRTQALVALSSAEAELYGIVKATAETMGLVSVMHDLGQVTTGHLLADASAALGILQRRGLGKVRHLNTNFLWVQEVAATRGIRYGKIDGKENAADMFTKAISGPDTDYHCETLKVEFAAGKNEQGYTIGYVGGRPPGNDYADLEVSKLGLVGPYSAWARTDLQARHTKTTMRGGPCWSGVVARLTLDATTGASIKTEHVDAICRNREHALLPDGPRDITTVLLYRGGLDSAKSTNNDAEAPGRGATTSTSLSSSSNSNNRECAGYTPCDRPSLGNAPDSIRAIARVQFDSPPDYLEP